MRSICFYSPAFRGGAGWFVFSLAQSLADTGGKVLLIAPEAEPVEREPKGPRIRRMYLPRGATGQGSVLFKAYRALLRIFMSFLSLAYARLSSKEFVVTFYDWTVVLVLQFAWIRLLGGKITYIVHDAKPHAWSYSERWRFLELYLLRMSYRLPNRIVTLTRTAMQELQSDYGCKSPVRVIPHGAFLVDDIKEMSGDGEILVFGMLRRNKRILETIQAMNMLSATARVRLTIAGAPHAEDLEYWRECERLLASSHHDISLEIGFVPEKRASELIERADALILPYEEFNSQSGVAVLGSLSGRLLIATNVGGIGELMDDGLEPVLIETPVSAATIAEAIERFSMMSLEERRGKAAASRSRLLEHLSWERIADEYWSFIRAANA